MSVGGRRIAPALIQQGQWLTVPDCKRILVVVHTIPYAYRLRDVVSLLESDLRVQAVFTVAPHAFGEGVARYLRRMGISLVGWDQAVRQDFDLALAAGSRGIDQVRAPLLLTSHGAGHIKLLRAAEGAAAGETGVPGGLSRTRLTYQGRVVPAAIALSHEEGLRVLGRSCPEALPVASVVGDPCVDRITASLRLRRAYRHALGLRRGQRLILVSSTWGPSSSFGRFDALLPRLVGELPQDTYRTAVLVHPNVWAGHGGSVVRGWLAGFRRRGIVLLPPRTDWQPLLIAADWIIGDHGSVTAYGALTGVPIVMARFPERGVAAGSPGALLARTAPALSPVAPLSEQLEHVARNHRPEAFREAAARLSSEPGGFNRLMRALLYRLLGLGEPAYAPAVEPAPLPPPLSASDRNKTGGAAA